VLSGVRENLKSLLMMLQEAKPAGDWLLALQAEEKMFTNDTTRVNFFRPQASYYGSISSTLVFLIWLKISKLFFSEFSRTQD